MFLEFGDEVQEREDLEEAIVSLESAVSSLSGQGPLSTSFAAEVCSALADVYFEAGDKGQNIIGHIPSPKQLLNAN